MKKYSRFCGTILTQFFRMLPSKLSYLHCLQEHLRNMNNSLVLISSFINTIKGNSSMPQN